MGEVTCQFDFSPVLHAALIRQSFLTIQNGKVVLMNNPNTSELKTILKKSQDLEMGIVPLLNRKVGVFYHLTS